MTKLTDPDFLQDPARVLARLRAEGPLAKIRMPIVGDIWVPTTDAGNRTLLKHPELFNRNPGPATGRSLAQRFWWMPRSIKPLMHTMITQDDPEHRNKRRLVELAFARATIDDLRPRIEALADRLLDDIRPGPQVDIVAAYTRTLPFLTICELLGIPHEMHASLQHRLAPLSLVKNPLTAVYAVMRLRGVQKMFQGLFHEARARPGPGLISALVHAEEDGARLSPDDLSAMVMLLFLAGHETTVHLINNTLVALAEDPALRLHFRDHPETRPLMIEEFVRYFSPVVTTKAMFVAEDNDLLGVPLKKGEPIAALLIAANYDPDRFDAPETVRPDRRPNAHLGFGFGPHVCLGMQLARMETAVAVERLLNRWPDYALAVPPVWLRRPGLRAPARVIVSL